MLRTLPLLTLKVMLLATTIIMGLLFCLLAYCGNSTANSCCGNTSTRFAEPIDIKIDWQEILQESREPDYEREFLDWLNEREKERNETSTICDRN